MKLAQFMADKMANALRIYILHLHLIFSQFTFTVLIRYIIINVHCGITITQPIFSPTLTMDIQ